MACMTSFRLLVVLQAPLLIGSWIRETHLLTACMPWRFREYGLEAVLAPPPNGSLITVVTEGAIGIMAS